MERSVWEGMENRTDGGGLPEARRSPRVGATLLIRLSPENWMLSRTHPPTSSYLDYYRARSLSPALSDVIKPEERACDSATPGLSSLACSWLGHVVGLDKALPACLRSGREEGQEAREKKVTGWRTGAWPWLPRAIETQHSAPSPSTAVPLACPRPLTTS